MPAYSQPQSRKRCAEALERRKVRILEVLAERGPMTQVQIAPHVGCHASSLGEAVQELYTAGYARKGRVPKGRSRYHAPTEITEAGKAYLEGLQCPVQ
ncbi:MAG: MarR family transcriptional regulator [Aeromonas sp.]